MSIKRDKGCEMRFEYYKRQLDLNTGDSDGLKTVISLAEIDEFIKLPDLIDLTQYAMTLLNKQRY